MDKALACADGSDLETEWANELGAIEYVWLVGLIIEEECAAVLGAVFSEITKDRVCGAVWTDETVAEFYYFDAQKSSHQNVGYRPEADGSRQPCHDRSL